MNLNYLKMIYVNNNNNNKNSDNACKYYDNCLLIKLNRKNYENEYTYKNKHFYLKQKITKYSLMF